MGFIQDKINAKVPKAFDGKLGDAVRPFAGMREIAGEYDPATGTSTTVVAYSGRGVFGSFRQEEVDSQHLLATDVKLTCLQNEVTDTPAVDDEISGYAVINVRQDPAASIWIVQLRNA
tara:strand:- start:44674 stop:45027 length:354 start_codon:yes stop_codon:yes gene_type:complete